MKEKGMDEENGGFSKEASTSSREIEELRVEIVGLKAKAREDTLILEKEIGRMMEKKDKLSQALEDKEVELTKLQQKLDKQTAG